MQDAFRVTLGRRPFLAGAAGLAMIGAAPVRAQARPEPPPIPDAWRDAEALPLWPEGPPSGGFVARPLPSGWPATFIRNIERPALHVFRPAVSNGRALLSIPGGAYTFVSILNEGVDVTREMTKRGYTVFVLTYRLPDEGWADRPDVPLQDAQRAMRVIRANAVRYGFDPATVAALGFSAGGHLGASLATGFAEALHAPRDAADRLDARPAAMGLVYPVIEIAGPETHGETSLRLLGEAPAAELVARRSPARHVTAETPPTFLAHCFDDGAVPVENSLIMMRALRAASRPIEMQLFEKGGHGFGVGPADKPWGRWLGQFASWLDQQLA